MDNSFCKLDYKTEQVSELVFGYEYNYISPLEKCDKPKNKKDYYNKLTKIICKYKT
jgi:hypothetical protein